MFPPLITHYDSPFPAFRVLVFPSWARSLGFASPWCFARYLRCMCKLHGYNVLIAWADELRCGEWEIVLSFPPGFNLSGFFNLMEE